MALQAVIFDLDLTLISSSAAEQLRKERAWPAVYKLIPRLEPYEGVTALIASLQARNVRTAIVTSSPRPYCGRVISQWEWNITTTVCYHDTTHKKPHPAPILKALEKLDVPPGSSIAVGDMPADIASARAAGVFSVAALWGAADPRALLAAKPDLSCRTVSELAQFIEGRLGQPTR